jgi:hypothetical protein
VPTNQQPSGDYGYDLVHEDMARRDGPARRAREEDTGGTASGPEAERSGDLSYDEAHDF